MTCEPERSHPALSLRTARVHALLKQRHRGRNPIGMLSLCSQLLSALFCLSFISSSGGKALGIGHIETSGM